MRKIVFIFIFFMISVPGFAQDKIVFPSEILSSVNNSAGSLLALNTVDSIYIIETSNLQIKKRWAHHQRTPVLLGFHPLYDNVLLMQRQLFKLADPVYGLSVGSMLENYQRYDRKYQEHPEDSIIMWDIAKSKIVNTVSGCLYMQFGNKQNCYVAAYNNTFPFESGGKKLYGSSGAELESRNGDFNFKSYFKKACRKLVLSSARNYFAASWRDGYINDTLYFSFSINDFNDHSTIYLMDKLLGLPTDFCFSENGDLLAITISKGIGNGSFIRVIDIKSRKIITEINEDEDVENLQFSENSKEIYYKKSRGMWFGWSLSDSRIIQKVWANITDLSSIKNTILLGEKLILIGEYWPMEVGVPMGSNKKYVLQALSLDDVSLFSKTKTEQTESYADSTAYTMLLNDVTVNNSDPVLHFSPDRTIFTRVDNGSQLQIWQSQKRKKILQKSFENKINAFPDKSGNNILIIEKDQQSSFNEFVLHIMTLSNSILKSSAILNGDNEIMNGSYYLFDCIADPVSSSSWFCIDGSEHIWKVSGVDFSMKKIASFPDANLTHLQASSDGKLYVSGNKKNEGTAVWVITAGDVPSKIVDASSKVNFQVLKDAVWMWNYKYDGDSTIEVWKDGKQEKLITINGNIVRVDASPDLHTALVQYTVKSYNYIQQFIDGIAQSPQNTELISTKMYMLQADELLSEKDGFTTYLKNATRKLQWSVKTPQVLDITNFDVSVNGRFILFRNRIIDLREIDQWDIYKYNTSALLDDSAKLSWIEIYEESIYSDKKAGFTLQKFIQGKKDTIKSKTWIYKPEKGYASYFNHDQLKTSPDKKWAISYVKVGSLNIDEVKAPPMLWNLSNLHGEILPSFDNYYDLNFSPDGKKIIYTTWKTSDNIFSTPDYDVYTYQLNPFKLLKTRKGIKWNKTDEPSFGDQFKLGFRNVEWLQPDSDSMKLKKVFYSKQHLTKVIYNKEVKKVIAGSSSGTIIIWEVNGSASPVVSISVHTAPLKQMVMRGNRIYSLAENGEIAITSIDENKLKVQIKTLLKDDELRISMNTPEGFFRVDPDLMNDMHFVKNGEIYPLSSFELQGNRPDKVYEAIGLADTAFIAALRESWETRIRRIGLDPKVRMKEINRPVVKWNRENLPVITSDTVLQLNLKIKDDKQDLKTLFIKVNGVPVSGRKGIAFEKGKRQLDIKPKIALGQGTNAISVIAVNAEGAESIESTYDIQCDRSDIKKRRLIYIGIGVSAYQDTLMNLRYAAKDVRDIAKQISYYFDSVEVHTLVNEQATKDRILSIKNYLQQSTTDDIVMISFSGHGMIAKGNGFFFAPYNMNFERPDENGVSMEMIEDLLDDIPARRRLLLLDACHSGEEWNTGGSSIALPDGVVMTKPRGIIIDDEETINSGNKRNSYLLMKELFNDFSRGNGAFMISAAASNEYAFEGEQWNNGVFTKSFLEALSSLKNKRSYSSENEAQIRVRDLRKLIYKKVSELTNGLQNPTSRQENGWWNWSF